MFAIESSNFAVGDDNGDDDDEEDAQCWKTRVVMTIPLDINFLCSLYTVLSRGCITE